MTDKPAKRKQVFVISPIGSPGSQPRKHADLFLKYIVREALPESEYNVVRADEEDSPYAITESMLGRILQADLCVADITGLNPNVMYELALAHAAAKKVVIMTADEGPIPFDIKDSRVVKYGLQVDEAQEAVKQLRDKATHVPPPGSFEQMLNPVASAFREWTQRQQVSTAEGGTDKALVAIVEKLEEKVERIDSRTRPAKTGTWKDAPAPSHGSFPDLQDVEGLLGFLRIQTEGPHRVLVFDLLRRGEDLKEAIEKGGPIPVKSLTNWAYEVADFRDNLATPPPFGFKFQDPS
ncbi:hypothetical protein [Paenarthrobacter nicotinovorans]|uniref:hypothetical protein n=1 Tax=Paenarthrobacter nicotinovorans TaxID=29320 RepID=UPI0011A1E8D8|nr:hypothetical protein [Paenarthrobacter nicotinovorans]